MYGIIGFIIGCLIYWFIIEPIKIKKAKKDMVYFSESNCWVPKDEVKEYYTLSCPYCSYIWHNKEAFPKECPNCGAKR